MVILYSPLSIEWSGKKKPAMRILIVEDELVSCEALKLNLESWGHQVEICRDGSEAWAALQKPDAPKLAILDWMMPEMDGVELCRRVRTLEHGKSLYLILLTSKGSPEDLVEGLEAGADDYVIKPFGRQELKARIQVGIRVANLQEQLIEAEQMRVLSLTTGAAAHEINQPLTIIIGKADMLTSKIEANSPILSDIADIQNASQRISDIIIKMGAAKKFVTKEYVPGTQIVDFDQMAEE